MNHKKKLLALSLGCLLAGSSVVAQSVYPGQHTHKIALAVQPAMQAECFDLHCIRLLDSPFKENMKRESSWILSLDVQRLLHSFRTNVGVWSQNEGGYFTVKKLGGWESLDCDLRGHSTGHILSGLAMLYAQTGDDVYKIKADSLVAGLAEVQKAIGTGYLSAFPEGLIDRNIAGQRVWAPWYTLHKIFAGLIDQYLYCNNNQALIIACGMANWAYQKLSPLTADVRAKMIRNEFGGVNDAFYNLYSITKNKEYEKLAQFFYHQEVLAPLSNKDTDFDRKHANTFIPKLIGEARNYEINNNKPSRELAEFFWNTVIDHQTFVTGSNSDKEKFIKSGELSKHLTGYTGETCNVYNMLKLTRHLYCWDAQPRYMDYTEKVIFNQLLGQQDPVTGMVAYFLPLLPGAHKVYSTSENSFWCCVGSAFESQAKFGESVYFHNDKGIFVNLFIPSIVQWKEKGITLRQETKFPESEQVSLTVETNKNISMPIYLRYPSWTKNVKVTVNGKRVAVKQRPNSYITIDRTWKSGDKIEAIFPMELTLVPTNDDPNKAALVYGPIVLAGKMGTEGMISGAPYSNPLLYNDYYTYNYNVPATLKTSLHLNQKRLSASVKQLSPLIFVADGITLEPLYRIHRERYVVYWDVLAADSGNKQASRPHFTPMDSLITRWVQRGYYPGASAIILKNDTLLFEKYYGTYTPQTEVYIASAGKWLAAAAIAAVVDQTDLSWDDSVEKWLPEFQGDPKGHILLRQLLSHTSGIPNYHPAPKRDTYNVLKDAVADILPMDTVFMAGSCFEYGGLAMQVAGRMAEMASGLDFETLFQTKIAQPLEMTHTHFTPVDLAGGHSPMLGGGARTTVGDYIHFLKMIFHNGMYKDKRILSIEVIQEMQADQVGAARVLPGEYIEKGRLHGTHTGIYGLGEWREKIDDQGEAYQISSPGWAGAYPWINKHDGVYGFFLAHVEGDAARNDGFSPFYDAPILSELTSGWVQMK